MVRRDRLGIEDVRQLFAESLEHQIIFSREFVALQERWADPQLVQLPEFKIFVRMNDFLVGVAIATQKEWEPHVQKELSPLLTPGSCFIDVGANVGYFTLLAASRVGPGGAGGGGVRSRIPTTATCSAGA